MRVASAVIFFASLSARQVLATWDTNAPSFNCPANTDNECTPDQEGGFDWGNLPTGGFDNYGGFDFSGFSCENRFGRRDELTKRTFQSKCITGRATRDNGPSFNCGNKPGFSVTDMEISVDEDADVEFHYDMPDGSTCRHTTRCTTGGTTVRNNQCGGAKSVTFKMPRNGNREDCNVGVHRVDFDCTPPENTSSASSSTPTPTPSSSSSSLFVESSSSSSLIVSSSSSSTPVVTPSSSTPSSPAESTSSTPGCEYPGGPGCEASSTSSAPGESTSSTPGCDYPGGPGCEASSTSSVPGESTSSTPEVTPSSSTSSTPGSPVESPSSTPGCDYPGGPGCEGSSTSSTPAESTSSTPESPETPTTSSTPSSPETPSSSTPAVPSSTFSFGCDYPGAPGCESSTSSAPGESSTSSTPGSPETPSSSTTPSSPETPTTSSTPSSPETPTTSSVTSESPVPTVPCPGVLPQCMNTWMFETDCSDNADFSCYCRNTDFTSKVIECVSAWVDDDSIIQEALSYFVGICAEFVPENPGIVTDCPSFTPPAETPAEETPAPSSSTPASPEETPETTPSSPETPEETITTEIVVSTVTTCPAGQTITEGGVTTVLPTPSISTIYSTSTATVCPGCTGGPAVPSSAPAVGAPSSPAVTSAPAPSSAAYPSTTITVDTTVTVPCTESEGPSAGATIPGSSTTSVVSTCVTVPQVHFTSTEAAPAGATATREVAVGLVPGTPAPVPAESTPAAPVAPSTLGTVVAPVGPTASSTFAPFEGAGTKVRSGVGAVVVGGVAAVLML
ncbi:hypothetical protein BDY21DRAFT_343205 [Lineolata rhizophorae]|uniref:CFEM domain-containing protein n=1 Tax=Lineolata rhizophorae TaxID=578093 RepID=A0A6A6P2I6_9PEZI|nr:hypothetical protein BDY21DRAFT_343205 [Lineolata rhizophorae]